MEKLYKYLGMIAMVVVIAAGLIYINGQYNVAPSVQPEFSGITVGNEYIATSTPKDGVWADDLIRRGWGTLGSVVITKAGNIEFALFDATSTAALDADNFVTSTALLTQFPAGTAVGTYTFDVQYINGLVLDVISGGETSSTTITFR